MHRLPLVSAGLVFGISALAVLVAPGASAQSPAYAITWSTVDGGGGQSSGGAYTLTGTAGQPDAGAQTGGVYALVGGFWGTVKAASANLVVHAPVVAKGSSAIQ